VGGIASSGPDADHCFRKVPKTNLKQTGQATAENSASWLPSWEAGGGATATASTAVPVRDQLASCQAHSPKQRRNPARHKRGRGGPPARGVGTPSWRRNERNHCANARYLDEERTTPYAPPGGEREPLNRTLGRGRDRLPTTEGLRGSNVPAKARLSRSGLTASELFPIAETLVRPLWIRPFDGALWDRGLAILESLAIARPPRIRAPIERKLSDEKGSLLKGPPASNDEHRYRPTLTILPAGRARSRSASDSTAGPSRAQRRPGTPAHIPGVPPQRPAYCRAVLPGMSGTPWTCRTGKPYAEPASHPFEARLKTAKARRQGRPPAEPPRANERSW